MTSTIRLSSPTSSIRLNLTRLSFPTHGKASKFSDEALNESKTTHTLKRGDKMELHIDYKQMGLGGFTISPQK
ncbi:MAG TPA: hypothetical protein DD786_06100 [Porphyromonadaceae bacterium]|nr:hypothetical protein [Porphyromonadaceae bacterium]HBU45356.1 hypothetical protein [Porphyromonadaceae bacterium]